MNKLRIVNIDNYNYLLEDENGKEYNLFIELMNTNIVLKKGMILYIHSELLDKNYKEYSNMYTFGSLGSNYSRSLDKENYVDIIVVINNNKKEYLQRYYG